MRPVAFLALLLSVGLWLSGGGVLAATPVAGERPHRVRVVCDNNYPPYSFRSEAGQLQGILLDQWKLWEKKTGITVEMVGTDWADAVQRFKAGEFDVIASIVETPARREFMDFTPPFAPMEVPIFFWKDMSGITDIASLKGFPVAVKAGDQHIDLLKAQGVTTLVTFPNHEAIVRAAAERKIGIFMFDAPSAYYHLYKAGLGNDFRHTAPMFLDELRRGVRKGDRVMWQTVVDGFDAISPAELSQIDEKWYGRTLDRQHAYLSFARRGVIVALLLIACLAAWSWALRAKIRQRTAALGESEERFRQIAENTADVFWLATADLSRILYVNPAYEVLWGRSCESLARDPHSFLTAIHVDDRPAVIALAADNRERSEIEYRVVLPDRSVRWVHDRRFTIRDQSDRPYRVAGIVEDITDRKLATEALHQADDRIRQFIDAIPLMAWSLKADGTVDFLNRRWCDYLGTSLAQMIAEPLGLIHPEDAKRVAETWEAARIAGGVFEAEMRLRRADGQYRWFLVRTEPFRDDNGAIVKWFGASVDIQQRKVAEETLRQKKQQLRVLIDRLHIAREEEAKRIARELHDDLGQQLTALKLQLDHLQTTVDGAMPALSANFQEMQHSVTRMVEVVQTLAGELRLGHIDLLGLTAAIEWHLKEFSRRTGITCRTLRLDEIGGLTDAQNTAVFRILQEALTNIIRHAAATEVEISLHAAASQLVLTIRDNGRGITAAEVNHRKAIGLLGMRERAEVVGGSVTVTGESGQGTTVSVTMPLLPPS